MWQAEIKSRKMINGVLVFSVIFSKEDQSFEKLYQYASLSSKDQVAQAIKSDIGILEQLDAFSGEIPDGPIQLKAEEVDAIEVTTDNIKNPEK